MDRRRLPAARWMPLLVLIWPLLATSAPLLATPEPDAASAPAAEPASAEPAPTTEQLHDELRAVRDAMEKALNERDLDGLLQHVTPDVVFTTMNSDVARGPQEIRAYFKKMLEGEDAVVDKVTTHFKPDTLSLLYGDTAIAYGVSEDHYELKSGQIFDIEARWTATLVRQDGRYLIAAFHYSANVFDNPILATQRRVLIQVAGAAVLIAFLVAFFLGRALGKKAAR